MAPKPLDYETPPRQRIESILNQINNDSTDLPLYQALREASLAYTGDGGAPLNILATFRLGHMTPVQRLHYLTRLWAFDPGNRDVLDYLIMAAIDCEYVSPAYRQLALWLDHLASAARQG